ncbi:tRNA (adenosine(37)-N6)-threonylcarbamoyltransferase complex transferase subunit TsaD [Candidatus Nomurabacteria bacterium]|nr:tRNA (adenosine(37)-N6)-threonylcarbamoyltransferase complex transferase subunit TsaD [Candidatus Nomurabacteria bacterium]
MNILSIETSCDETAISILRVSGNTETPQFTILGNHVASQIALHAQYGGVFPALAKREHVKAITPLFIQVLKDANMHKIGVNDTLTESVKKDIETLLTREVDMHSDIIQSAYSLEKPQIDAIAITTGPGLEPALWVGVNFAKTLSMLWNIPLIPVNHMEGHVMSVVAQTSGDTFEVAPITFPALSLLVSGGHTELVVIRDWMVYEKIGQTKDDAVGEAFDKVARIVGLPYPGGPAISALAREAREQNLPREVEFPRPMLHSGTYDFSYSGLKTAVLYKTKEMGALTDEHKKIIAREFEEAAIEVLVKKTLKAIDQYSIQTVMVGGGVANNSYLQSELRKSIKNYNPEILIYFPRTDFSTDNALMIGVAGYYQFLKNKNGAQLDTVKACGTMTL